ncbi:4'-phosphopantetheinyl transferase superfamily protein [Streptomyces sp. ISL-98]|uniref:4'-phosphopantetheinyl transferase family protein n=1 Tax=Streptomyces sp. ISL-98 TaxID=2819192 RepID=UPI001BEC55DD|nr:4'-phosphopantetheinyl transferase superfamily protein [Streptomyces sp. ISL-98]MBT2510562.1 4'-phosphopantetheinyl transferase superfamily protein [Streptomyces sp. ISL-98]
MRGSERAERAGMDAAVTVRWSYAEGSAPRDHARALLRSTAAEVAGVFPADVRIGRAASGAPELSGAAEGLLASVSHTRGLVAVAVSRPRDGVSGVGVDVEAVRPLDADTLAERWFTPDEAAWVRALPPALRPVGLLDLWTRKESVGKALGLGLAGGGLRRPVGAPPPGTPPASARPLSALPGAPELSGAVLPGPAGYVLACALRGAGTPPPTVHVTERKATPCLPSNGHCTKG